MCASTRNGFIGCGGPAASPRTTNGKETREVNDVLEHRPETAAAARHIVIDALDAWQVDPDVCDSVVLVVSELVTNAVEHAEPPLALHLRHEDTDGIRVAVSDGGPSRSAGAWTASCEEDEHGRGLNIVDALADTRGMHHHDNGTTTRWAYLKVC
ncbi:ATP-binding protein [Streptomyces sp. NPDC088752]|uniref:ATP-binding protein n=1 Tax=Streptomyces sp. NPDC088752 TaxID=3154963 RepID=UPI0034182C0E